MVRLRGEATASYGTAAASAFRPPLVAEVGDGTEVRRMVCCNVPILRDFDAKLIYSFHNLLFTRSRDREDDSIIEANTRRCVIDRINLPSHSRPALPRIAHGIKYAAIASRASHFLRCNDEYGIIFDRVCPPPRGNARDQRERSSRRTRFT